MPRVWTVHGIWSTGDASVDLIGRQMAADYGWEHQPYDYPHRSLLDQRSDRKLTENARDLAYRLQTGDHVVGHSNAAGIIYRALEMTEGKKLGVIYLVAPAFSKSKPWPWGKFSKLVIHANRWDLALMAGSMLVRHRFGPLGRVGYEGEHPQVICIRESRLLPPGDRLGHSDVFATQHQRNKICRRLRSEAGV